MDHDLGLTERPEVSLFDDMLLHVDGWLCEDQGRPDPRRAAAILGAKTQRREQELDLVLAIWPAVRRRSDPRPVAGTGLAEDGTDERATVDQTEAKARELVAPGHRLGPSAAD